MKAVQLQLRAVESYHPNSGELVNEQPLLVNWQLFGELVNPVLHHGGLKYHEIPSNFHKFSILNLETRLLPSKSETP